MRLDSSAAMTGAAMNSLRAVVSLLLGVLVPATAVAAAKVQIGKSGKFIGQQSIQLHGGMGMTDQLKVGDYFKRLSSIDLLLGILFAVAYWRTRRE